MTKSNNNIQKRAINSGIWVTVGYGTQQVLRLGSNLILTRLLFPDAFGLMAIIQTVMMGLIMMSDIGIQPSIVQNERGHEPAFLNTAWTLQIIQGLLIFLILVISAPYFANFYAQPLLSKLLPVVGISAIIAGFNSTKLASANRDMQMGKATLIELVTYIISVAITVFLAWMHKYVWHSPETEAIWALVWGTLVGNFLKMLATHYLLPGVHNKIGWEKAAGTAIFGFGSWIFVNSSLTFLAGEGSKLLVAKLLTVKMLAFYTLASTMSLIFWQAMMILAVRTLFPAYSEVLRNQPEKMRSLLTKARLGMIGAGGLVALFFVFFGDQFMWLIYDKRYHETGVMLRILGMGSLAAVVVGSYTGVLFAKGKVSSATFLNASQIVLQVGAILIGYQLYGEKGVIISLAAIYWLVYPVHAYVMHKNDLWQPKIDLPFLAFSVVVSCFVFINLHYI
ncbi:MAG: oligosaccharide flippase family protein [Methylophilaceae bacterium]